MDYYIGDILYLSTQVSDKSKDSEVLKHMKFFDLSFPEKFLIVKVSKENYWQMIKADPECGGQVYPFDFHFQLLSDDGILHMVTKTRLGEKYSIDFDILETIHIRVPAVKAEDLGL